MKKTSKLNSTRKMRGGMFNKNEKKELKIILKHIWKKTNNSLKKDELNEIMRELAKNIHPDPSKRNSLSELLETSKKLLNCDWTFINVLEDEKIDRLWKN